MTMAFDNLPLAASDPSQWIEVAVWILAVGGTALASIVNEYRKRSKDKADGGAGGEPMKPPPRAEPKYPTARPMPPVKPPPVPPRPAARPANPPAQAPTWRPDAPGPVAPGPTFEDWRPKPSPKPRQPVPAPQSDWRPQPTPGPIPPPKPKKRRAQPKQRRMEIPPSRRSSWDLQPTEVPDPRARAESASPPKRATSVDPTAPAEPLELHHLEISDNLRISDPGAVSGLPAAQKTLREDLGLHSRESLKRAVILREILGPPVGLRDWD